MNTYEVMVVCEVSAIYEIEAESEQEAMEEARETWSRSDLDTYEAELVNVLVESPRGSRNFV